MLYFLVYVSSAVVPFSSSELVDLLERSRVNNTRLGVSGMLLYKDGNLMQVLEGEEQTVKALYAKIAEDRRHKGLLRLMEGALEARQFADWSMAFRDLNGEETRGFPGYSEFLNTPLTGEAFAADPTRSRKLLLTFKRRM
jgi:hypothetical protein